MKVEFRHMNLINASKVTFSVFLSVLLCFCLFLRLVLTYSLLLVRNKYYISVICHICLCLFRTFVVIVIYNSSN